MSSIPIKKQLIGFIFLLLICFPMPLDATTVHVPSGWPGITVTAPVDPLRANATVRCSVSPTNGIATVSCPDVTNHLGNARVTVLFDENACGTYKVRVWIDTHPESFTEITIVHSESCPTAPSSGTTSPPPSSELVKLSDDNQVTRPDDSVTFIVELQDSDGNPIPGADLNFIFFGDPDTASLDPETATTDANGRAQTTFTLSADAEGEYIVEAYSSQDFGVYVNFTVTVDTSLPKATRLEKISGDNQTGFAGEPLMNPFVVQVRDQYNDPLEGVTVTFAVTAGDGSLSGTTVTTDQDGQAKTTLTLGTEPGTNTIEATVEGISQTVVFNAEAALPPPTPSTLSIGSDDSQTGLIDETLADPFVVEVRDQYGDPIEGVPVTFTLLSGDDVLSVNTTMTAANGQAETTFTLGGEPGGYTVEAIVEGIAETAIFNIIAELLQFDLSLSIGLNLIHLPLRVRVVDGMPATIQSVSDLYNALGGGSTVNYLITHDSQTQTWHGYFGDADQGTTADRRLTDQTGILVDMLSPVSVRLSGDALGTDGRSTITLNQGLNLVGLPLKDLRVTRVSDLFTLDGIGGNTLVIILSDGGGFQSVGRAGDPGDIEITGGQSFIMTAQRAAMVDISGEAWTDVSGAAASPPVTRKNIEGGNSTPVLALKGSVVDEEVGLQKLNPQVTVKNLSTGRAVTGMTIDEGTGYRLTVVDIETGRAATIGDMLEISAQSPHPFIGVEPLRYRVTIEDVKQSLIQLPELVVYKIPAETELLRNYPNPFNPETWIPYRLADDAFVTLTIYDGAGQVVRTLDVGYRIASAYESRSKAIYWDGRNDVGERVASGVYFYTLTAGDYSATRKMLILK